MGGQRGKNQDKKMQSLPRKGKKCRLTRANGVVVGDLVLFVFGLFSFVGFFLFVCLIFIFNFFFSMIEIF